MDTHLRPLNSVAMINLQLFPSLNCPTTPTSRDKPIIGPAYIWNQSAAHGINCFNSVTESS
ncbi:hypothetical protein FVEN_g13155 [Fusarium venenatum]|nr:hypothetical protein FVEN_g13155 [Fusarium venenatum]